VIHHSTIVHDAILTHSPSGFFTGFSIHQLKKFIAMNVSIIVPVYVANAAEYHNAARRLAWLSQLSYRHDYEVIIVDNASAYGFGLKLQQLCVGHGYRYINYSEQRSSYAARNEGLAHARYDVIAFTDADCTPIVDWLEHGTKALAQYGGIIAGHIQFTFQRPHSPTVIEYIDSISHLQQRQYAAWGYSATANLITYRKYFDTKGGFPEVRSLGDREWCQRSGLSVTYCPEAITFHPARTTLKSLLRKVSIQAYAIHRLNYARLSDLFRLTLPLRVWTNTFANPQLPRSWNKIEFLWVLHLFRWVSVIQSWKAFIVKPEREPQAYIKSKAQL
jgi:GT2 family glycosyltransferase